MSEKKFNSRIINKHDTEENWNKSSFIPKQGEVIIYDIDSTYNYERIKIGDGANNVNDLPFAVVQSDYSTNDKLSPSYIKNRTHWSDGAIVVSWDGNINGLTVSSDSTSYKVSDYKPGSNEIIGGQLTFSNGTTETITSDMIEGSGYILSVYNGVMYINTSSGSTYDSTMDLTLPKPGIYFQKNSYNQLVSFSYGDEVVHQLNEKYIPETIARMTEVEKKLDKSGGIMTGNIDMGGKNITGANEIDVDIANVTTLHLNGAYINATPGSAMGDSRQVTFSGTADTDDPVRVSGVATPTGENDAVNKLYADTRVILETYAVTLSSSSWTGSAAPYSQTVTVSGILATDTPYIAPAFSSTSSTAVSQQQAWNLVSMAESFDGSIIFSCFEKKPLTDIPLKIEVVRYGCTAVDGSEVSY